MYKYKTAGEMAYEYYKYKETINSIEVELVKINKRLKALETSSIEIPPKYNNEQQDLVYKIERTLEKLNYNKELVIYLSQKSYDKLGLGIKRDKKIIGMLLGYEVRLIKELDIDFMVGIEYENK